MRILFLADRIPPFEIGGGGKIPWLLAQDFQKQGHEIFIISSTPQASYKETRENIHIYYLHSAYPDRWRAWVSVYNPAILPSLRKLLAQIQPDVVNVHNIHTYLSYASIRLASQMGYPVVFSCHDLMPFAYGKVDYFINQATCQVQPEDYRLPSAYNLRQMRLRYNPFRNIAIRRILTHYTQVRIAISHAHQQALEINGLPPFRVVYHGFDAAHYQRPAESIISGLRSRLNLEGRQVIFLGGRLTVGKGSRQMLEALNQTVRDYPQVTLLTLAATPFDRSLLTGLDNLQPEHICEGGWLAGDELLAAYHLADIIAIPSIYLDPVPTTVFEAMAVGKPALVTCYGGSPEVVVEGQTGFVVNPFDVATFAERLKQLLNDPTLREKMGNAAQAHLIAHFSRQHMLDGMLEAYQTAVSLVSANQN